MENSNILFHAFITQYCCAHESMGPNGEYMPTFTPSGICVRCQGYNRVVIPMEELDE